MENSNRSDAENTFRKFFEGLDEAYQREMIKKMQKKPPDSTKDLHDSQQREWERIKADRAESEGGPTSDLINRGGSLYDVSKAVDNHTFKI